MNAIDRLTAAGIDYDDAVALRRIAMTLHRWHELECGDGNAYASWCLERDEATDLPYMVIYPHQGETRRHRVPDRERGAVKRLGRIMQRYPALHAYVQTDPRGAALYILRPEDIPAGATVEAAYPHGIAVYK